MIITSYMWLFKFKFKIPFLVALGTFQVPSSHLCLVVAMLDSTGTEYFQHPNKVLLDSVVLENQIAAKYDSIIGLVLILLLLSTDHSTLKCTLLEEPSQHPAAKK